MILCLPVFDLLGGLHALMFEVPSISAQLSRLGIYKGSNLFFADSTIYFLSKFYFAKDYILPLTYGAVGTCLLFKYLKKAKHGKKGAFSDCCSNWHQYHLHAHVLCHLLSPSLTRLELI